MIPGLSNVGEITGGNGLVIGFVPFSTNQAPLANDQNLQTNEDVATVVVLTGSDPDGGPNPLTFRVVSGPANGQLIGTAPSFNRMNVIA